MDEDSFQFMFNCSSDIDYGEDNADGTETESDAAQQSSSAKKPSPIIFAKDNPTKFLSRQNNPDGTSRSAQQDIDSRTPAQINPLTSCSLVAVQPSTSSQNVVFPIPGPDISSTLSPPVIEDQNLEVQQPGTLIVRSSTPVQENTQFPSREILLVNLLTPSAPMIEDQNSEAQPSTSSAPQHVFRNPIISLTSCSPVIEEGNFGDKELIPTDPVEDNHQFESSSQDLCELNHAGTEQSQSNQMGKETTAKEIKQEIEVLSEIPKKRKTINADEFLKRKAEEREQKRRKNQETFEEESSRIMSDLFAPNPDEQQTCSSNYAEQIQDAPPDSTRTITGTLAEDTGEQADKDAADTPTVHQIEERHGNNMRERPNVKLQLLKQSNFLKRDGDFWYEYTKSREDFGNLQRKFELQGWIEKKLRNVLKIDGITMYGSSVHSSAFKWSHLDLTIILPDEIEKDEEISILEKLQLHFKNEKRISECKVLMGMRSILWLKLEGSNQSIHQLHKIFGLQVDLSINNWSGIQSSAILHHYDSQNQLMGALSLLVKKWAIKKQLFVKKRPNEMLFSSYSLNLMVVHYLQKVGLLPYLQDDDPAFFTLNKRLDQGMNRMLPTWHNSREFPIEEHFRGFMKYFAEFQYATERISIRKHPKKNDDPLIAIYIEDPINDANIANVRVDQIVEEFKETAIKLDSSHCAIKDLFAI